MSGAPSLLNIPLPLPSGWCVRDKCRYTFVSPENHCLHSGSDFFVCPQKIARQRTLHAQNLVKYDKITLSGEKALDKPAFIWYNVSTSLRRRFCCARKPFPLSPRDPSAQIFCASARAAHRPLYGQRDTVSDPQIRRGRQTFFCRLPVYARAAYSGACPAAVRELSVQHSRCRRGRKI